MVGDICFVMWEDILLILEFVGKLCVGFLVDLVFD